MSRWRPEHQTRVDLRGTIVLTIAASIFTAIGTIVALHAVLAGADLSPGVITLSLGLAGIVIAAIIVVASNRVVCRILQPMRALRRAMRQVGQDQLGTRLEESGSIDFAVLARRFNLMSERLEQRKIVEIARTNELERDAAKRATEFEKASERLLTLDQAKDAFLSNVSHEMRTPADLDHRSLRDLAALHR